MSLLGIRGSGVLVLTCATFSLAMGSGCSSANLASDTGNGGQISNSGAPSTGGSVATDSTGGAQASGGSASVDTGGTTAADATGGSANSNTGGAQVTAGSANSNTGGAKPTGGASPATGGAKATGGSSAVAPPTWSQLYTNYFGPNTAGDCVASGCHGPGGNSPSFNSATTMCSALKTYFGGTISFNSILTWLSRTNGNMPANGAAAPANAVADITAWQNAGAVCP
jgi:hypothetical protein